MTTLYESMFLLDQRASIDQEAGLSKVREILERAGAEIVSLRRWDERKLAYPIRTQKRGMYLLGLFRVDGAQITRIERDCHLSDEVLRVMVTRGDHIGEAEIEAELNADQIAADEARLREEGEESGASEAGQPAAAPAGEEEKSTD
ncbi:MAG: 30S ribosomal protein S6 [Phycisphaeraceae bacterium]